MADWNTRCPSGLKRSFWNRTRNNYCAEEIMRSITGSFYLQVFLGDALHLEATRDEETKEKEWMKVRAIWRVWIVSIKCPMLYKILETRNWHLGSVIFCEIDETKLSIWLSFRTVVFSLDQTSLSMRMEELSLWMCRRKTEENMWEDRGNIESLLILVSCPFKRLFYWNGSDWIGSILVS